MLVCCNGYFIGVELKAPKGTPSELQLWNLQKIEEAGGFGWLLYPDGFEDFKRFIAYLNAPMLEYAANKVYKESKGW